MRIFVKFLAIWGVVTTGTLIGPIMRGELPLYVGILTSLVATFIWSLGEYLDQKAAVSRYIAEQARKKPLDIELIGTRVPTQPKEN